MIASCSEDKTCKVWKNNGKPGEDKLPTWTSKDVTFSDQVPLWKVSWSHVGNMLAISGGDNQVHLVAEEPTGEWKPVRTVNEESVHEGQ